MRSGAAISGLLHVVLLAIALIGLRDAATPSQTATLRATDVSVVSQATFDAALSTAPKPGDAVAGLGDLAAQIEPAERPASDTLPSVPDAEFPLAPDTEIAPDLSTFTPDQPEIAVATALPEPQPSGEDSPLIAGPSFDGSINSNETALVAPAPPSLAPRIDTRASPKPPERVKPAEPEPAAEKDAEAEPEFAEPKEEAAPEAATTEVSLDAKETDDAVTPTAAMRPPGRPPAPEPSEEMAQRKDRNKNATAPASDQSDAVQDTNGQDAPETGARLGADFNAGEKQAVGDAIGPFWNKAPLLGKVRFEELVVIVRVQLKADGTLLGDITPVEPANPTGDFAIAFRQARIAVTKAVAAGLPLPGDKFRDGDFLEIRFDPSRDAVSFQ